MRGPAAIRHPAQLRGPGSGSAKAGPGPARAETKSRFLPHSRIGWVAALLPWAIPAAPAVGLGIGALATRIATGAFPIVMGNAGILAVLAAIVSLALGWIVLARGLDRSPLVWIMTIATSLLVLFVGLGEAFWWE
jgi:hypothetical protein